MPVYAGLYGNINVGFNEIECHYSSRKNGNLPNGNFFRMNVIYVKLSFIDLKKNF